MDKKKPEQFRIPITVVFFLLFLSIVHISHGGGGSGVDEELELLLSFKAKINDPLHILSNWSNSSNTICAWHGITCTNNSRIAAINLSGKNITGNISSSLFKLQFIETINLSNNQVFGNIPNNAFDCSSLKYLNLSNNNLTSSILGGHVSNLETLDLSNHMITGVIPPHIGSFLGLSFGSEFDFGNLPMN